jgi:hypothetical protein
MMKHKAFGAGMIVAALLVVSAVLAAPTNGYEITYWTVDGGGATFSAGGNYQLGGTVGQPDAGQLTGGSYKLGGGFWGGGAAAPPPTPIGPRFLPLVAGVPLPSLCDQYEPNNSRLEDPTGPIASNVAYVAKICANDVEPRFSPRFDFEDNYFFDTATGAPVAITLALPPTLVLHVALGVYASTALDQPIPGCFVSPEDLSTTPFTTSCPIPGPGRYIVRLYSADKTVDDVSPYTLLVTYQ